MRKPIVVDYIHPPIPNRNFDYTAYFDGYEPGDAIGYGPTAEDAVRDLLVSCDEWQGDE